MTSQSVAGPSAPSRGGCSSQSGAVWSEDRGRAAVWERSGGMCELGCGRRGTSFGHRKRRGQGGAWSPVNGLWLCGDGTRLCHGVLTGAPDLAKAGGWEVRADQDPEKVPVWLATVEGAGWWLLTFDDHGHVREPVPDPERYGLPARPRLPWESR